MIITCIIDLFIQIEIYIVHLRSLISRDETFSSSNVHRWIIDTEDDILYAHDDEDDDVIFRFQQIL